MKRLFNAHVRLVYKDEHGEQFISSAIADRGAFWCLPIPASQRPASGFAAPGWTPSIHPPNPEAL